MANLNEIIAGMNVSFNGTTNKATAKLRTTDGTIYFTKDTHEILVNGQSYGQNPDTLIGTPSDSYTTGQPTIFGALNKGAEALSAVNNIDLSVKADLVDGKVPANQLPSYVDDVIEIGVVKVGVYNNSPTFWKADTPDSYCGLDPMAYQEYLADGENGKFYYAVSGHSGALENVLLACTQDGNHFSVATTVLPAEYEAKKGKIYVRIDNNKTYRCSNEATAQLVEIATSDVYTDLQAQQAVVGTENTATKISTLRQIIASGGGSGSYIALNSLVKSTDGWSSTPSDDKVPSEKLVAESLEAIATQLTWG